MTLTASDRFAVSRTLAAALALALPVALPATLPVTLPLGLPAALALSLTSAGPGHAQSAPAAQPAAPALSPQLKQRDQELEAAREAQRKAAETQAKLKREIADIGDDRRALNQQLIDTAGRVREGEARIAATDERLKPLAAREQAIRTSLDARRATIAEILAALQRIGRKPPPALLVQPEDALSSVRSAMLLGATLPELREEAGKLAKDLTELLQVRQAITDERAQQARDLAAIEIERQRLDLLIGERQKRLVSAEKALAEERQRANQLARQVDNLKDLIAKLEEGLDKSTRAAREAARTAADSKVQGEVRPELAALSDPGRLAPAVAFASIKGRLPKPVNGVKIRDFGMTDGIGGTEKGLTIAARAGAQVTAPCDGWVVYAGPFRSYGQLLILNAGGGYHVLLAGMDKVSVDIGQFVLAGEPVALMGTRPQLVSVQAVGATQPILYVEFRKDGTPIDPSPWWANSESEKARG